MTSTSLRIAVVVSLIIPLRTVLPATAIADGAPAANSGEPGWGSLKGRIIFPGPVPAAEPLQITRDAEFCGEFSLLDESLVVDADSRGLRYVAIWLESRQEVPLHPALQKPAEQPVILDNRNCRFKPRLTTVRTGQTIEIRNSDPIAHNAAVFAKRNQPFSEVIPFDSPLLKTFPRTEILPIRVDCSIHAWMKAWLLIIDHPYMTITAADGSFEIHHLPAGEWTFRFWHERSGALTELSRQGQPVPLNRGIWTLTIPSAMTLDLGEITVPRNQLIRDN